MKTLKNLSLPRYQFLYIALFLTGFILVLEDFLYMLLLGPFVYFILIRHRNLVKIILVISATYLISRYIIDSKTIDESAQYNFKVIKVNNKDDYIKIIGTVSGNMVNIYCNDFDTVRPGYSYVVTGNLIPLRASGIPNTFNYKEYMLSKRTKYIINADHIKLEKRGLSIYVLPYLVENYIDRNIPKSKSYIKTFVLADKSEFDQSTINEINSLGISHLFAVSGLHIGLLVICINSGFKKFNVSENITTLIISIVLILYMVLTYFSPSVVRASLMYMLLVVNKRLRLKLSTLDIVSIILLTLLILNPYAYFNIGFILSFGITYIILLSKKILVRYGKFEQLFLLSLFSYISSFPIVLNLNKQSNLYTLVFNIIFLFYMTVIILPLSYITFLFPAFDILLYPLIKMYNRLIGIFSSIDYGIINGYITNNLYYMILLIMIYYCFISFERKIRVYQSLLILLFLVTLFINSNNFDPSQRVVFLDVDGDSILITDSFNKCNILVDTGNSDDYNSVIHYIRSRNVKRIDYLIVSHFHNDHFGELNDIESAFIIGDVISPNTVSNFSDRNIACGNVRFFIYKLSNEADNENNNSIIFSLYIGGKHYLFTGDSEKDREYEFVDNYNIDIDYLKIAHHGSSTSTTEKFLDSVKPEEVFIIAKYNNKFGHPNDIVIDLLNSKNIPINRTDIHGTIEMKYLFGYETKKYYMP